MSDDSKPILRVISGDPSDEEIAAILAVVAARGRASAKPTPRFSLWARKSRLVRPVQRPGFGAWRASTMPR